MLWTWLLVVLGSTRGHALRTGQTKLEFGQELLSNMLLLRSYRHAATHCTGENFIYAASFECQHTAPLDTVHRPRKQAHHIAK
jgi:hypothetical protein